MKIRCDCGEPVHDAASAGRARYVRALDWDGLLEAIDAAIESSGPSAAEKAAACQRVRTRLTSLSRPMWQCRACQRLHLDDQHDVLHGFVPRDGRASRALFDGTGRA